MPESILIELTVNGKRRSAVAEPRTLLSDFLRQQLSLTGTHVGCEQGGCGACTVRVDGALVRSCLMLAIQAAGSSVTTVEGLGTDGSLHPIQQAFQLEHGLQCGFCTPGFLLATQALLEQSPRPSEQEIREYLSGNICRCTGYNGIIAAVQRAASLSG